MRLALKTLQSMVSNRFECIVLSIALLQNAVCKSRGQGDRRFVEQGVDAADFSSELSHTEIYERSNREEIHRDQERELSLN